MATEAWRQYVPEGWGVEGGAYDDPTEKINWLNQQRVGTDILSNLGIAQGDIDWMLQHGYAGKYDAPTGIAGLAPAPTPAAPVDYFQAQPDYTYQDLIADTTAAPAAPAPLPTPQEMAAKIGKVLPTDWGVVGGAYDEAQEKGRYFQQQGITSQQLRDAGADLGDIAWLESQGYLSAAPSTVAPTALATPQRNEFYDYLYQGNADAALATQRGIEYAREQGWTPQQAVDEWNKAHGTQATLEDYYRVTGLTPEEAQVSSVEKPIFSNFGDQSQWDFGSNAIYDPQTAMIRSEGNLFQRGNEAVVSDELFWNPHSASGAELQQRVKDAQDQGQRAGVVITPYAVFQGKTTDEQLLNEIANSNVDFVGIDPYLLGMGVSSDELYKWAKEFIPKARALGKEVKLVTQGFAVKGLEQQTLEHNQKLLALPGISEFINFGREDAKDLWNDPNIVSINNDFINTPPAARPTSAPRDTGTSETTGAGAAAEAVAGTAQPDWSQGNQVINGLMYQPIYDDFGNLQEVLRYQPGQIGAGQSYERLDPTTLQPSGTGQFKEVGGLGDMLKTAAIDLAPLILTAVGIPGSGLAASIGASAASTLGISGLSAASTAALGSAVTNAALTAAQGGSFQDILTAAAASGLGNVAAEQIAAFAQTAGSQLGNLAGSDTLGRAITSGITAGVQAAPRAIATGNFGDIVTSALTGGATAGLTDIASQFTGLAPKDINAAVRFAQGVENKDWSAVLAGANNFLDSPDVALASKAAKVVSAVQRGTPQGLMGAMQEFGSELNKYNQYYSKTDTGDETARLQNRFGTANLLAGLDPTVMSGPEDLTTQDLINIVNPPGVVTAKTGATETIGDAAKTTSGSTTTTTTGTTAAVDTSGLPVFRNAFITTLPQSRAAEIIAEMYPGKSLDWVDQGVLNAAASHIRADDESGLRARLAGGQKLGAGEAVYGDVAVDWEPPPGTRIAQPGESGGMLGYTAKGIPVNLVQVIGTTAKRMTPEEALAYDRAQAEKDSDQVINPFTGEPYVVEGDKISQDIADIAKGVVSSAAGGIGEQINLLGVAGGWITGNKDNAWTQVGSNIQSWANKITPDSVKQGQDQISKNISEANGLPAKAWAAITGAATNPLATLHWIGKEGIQEVLPLGAAITVGRAVSGATKLKFGEDLAKRFGLTAAIGTDATMNAGESATASYQEVYNQLRNKGVSVEDASSAAAAAAAGSGLVTLFTAAIGDAALVNKLMNNVKGATLNATLKEGPTEFAEGALQSVAEQNAVNVALGRGLVFDPNEALTSGTLEALIGAGTTGAIAKGADIFTPTTVEAGTTTQPTKPFTATQARIEPTFDPSTVVATDPRTGDAITLGDLTGQTAVSTDSRVEPTLGLAEDTGLDSQKIIDEYVSEVLGGSAPIATDSFANVVVGTDPETGAAVTLGDLGLSGPSITAGATVSPDAMLATDAQGNTLTAADVGVATTPATATTSAATAITAPTTDITTGAATTTDPNTGVQTTTATDPNTGATTTTKTNPNTNTSVTAKTDPNTNTTTTTKTNINTGSTTQTEVNNNTNTTTTTQTDPNTNVSTKTETNTNTGSESVTTTDPNTGITIITETNPSTNITTTTEINATNNTTITTETNTNTNTSTTTTVNTTTGAVIDTSTNVVPPTPAPPPSQTPEPVAPPVAPAVPSVVAPPPPSVPPTPVPPPRVPAPGATISTVPSKAPSPAPSPAAQLVQSPQMTPELVKFIQELMQTDEADLLQLTSVLREEREKKREGVREKLKFRKA